MTPGREGGSAEAADWQRLDRRMLMVHPVKELGRFLPIVIALVFFGRSGSTEGPWGLVGVGIPIVLGLLRYVTTTYRIAEGRVELRHGLVNKQVLSTPLDRVRTVDLSASPIHRLLGLVTVRIGTGSSSIKGDERLVLDGLSQVAAEQLRSTLLRVSPSADPDAPPEAPARVVLRLDPSWVRFAPLTTSGLVIAGAALGFVTQAMHTLQISPRVNTDQVARAGLALLIVGGVVGVLVVLCVLSIVGYVVTNFGFVLSHVPTGALPTSRRDGSWHLRRGLFTTRETSLDDARVSGVTVGEPIGLRLAGGGRLSAIVTGLGKKQAGSSLLVPPAPRTEVDRVAVEVLGVPGPVFGPLRRHGPLAVRRRWVRALVPAAAVAAVCVVLTREVSGWFTLGAPTALVVVGLALAIDRVRGLGHALVDGHLVARSGSLDRRREALATPSVIGWNLRATWFQRRAGLTDLTATTAGGRQRVRVLDIPAPDATALASTAQPGLLDQFLV
ncbi:PH domain-containing protein [Nocardioides cynanchi]|uniref:PH domain-containing protein n=1 Tax=Nocardioides cynanchi TaxID=2558918 RepID=UPI001245BD42|nr:PH domain-containing protein [Nocardioides cynanchi]